MTQIEELEQEAFNQKISVDYIAFSSNRLNGIYIDNSIALKKGMSTAKTADTLAEELEHHYVTIGNILDQSDISNRKQEQLARFRAYNRRIGLAGIIRGYQQCCRNYHELAECLDVSEEFLKDALECYRQKYGVCVELDNYMIMFEPYLAVVEKF